ncbi:MAG TPA: hypothetical protein VLQ79_06555, partial [Myxococcaceae bacterium]|nr:hypothetical protein [Myxococcaceae bacterium]
MTDSPEEIARRFRAAVPVTDSTDCPPAEDFWSAAAGELPFERLSALVDHGAHCLRCAEAWSMLADVRRAAAEDAADPTPIQPVAGQPLRRARWARPFVPLALSAAVAAGLWLVLRPAAPGAPPVERGGSTPAVQARSAAVQPAAGAVLRWSEVRGASSYNVTVLTPDLVVVHQALGLSTSELRLPEAVGRRAAGGGLLWNVDAVLEDGRTVAS